MRSGFSVTGVLLSLALGGAALAAQPDGGLGEAPAPAAATAALPTDSSFARDVAPIFARWCTSCHGAREQHGNLRLDSYESALTGGDAGPPVVAADPAASLLIAKVERRDRPAMPPRKRLPKSALAAIRSWIAAGAPP